ncbi:DUF3604 domain-containing protein [Seohaeicola saemankumensis]|nr:DUF3604 domain-containing protein [Seohaeicola saemankumensis]MCA0872961.1 DUF3604 domain-containing protein [Seohaeicola saemankumensis]
MRAPLYSAVSVVLLSTAPHAQEVPPGGMVGEMYLSETDIAADPGRTFSPYAGRAYPTRPLWGDSHMHTALSYDAPAYSATLMPRDAYRFARGEEVIASHGVPAKLSRPLDWMALTEHSDAMGGMTEMLSGNPDMLADPQILDWYHRVKGGGEQAVMSVLEITNMMSDGTIPPAFVDKKLARSVWDDVLEVAEEFNEPGVFTALIGYEWTSTGGGNNLHRNIIYRDDATFARQMLPLDTLDSTNPEDLWTWMETYEDKTGGNILALAHNGNLSNGIMFPVETNPATGEPLGGDYFERRMKWEPLYEVTQMKGDGETHPMLSPEDEFADYETWDIGNMAGVLKQPEMIQYEYARQALRNGLGIEARTGFNPYKFGMVGSTDSHTALSTAEEDNYFGKHSGVEPSPDRWKHFVGAINDLAILGWETTSSGYAAVWATENTREAIFDAMERKEVYGTTGPRITVRFFGGWDFTEADTLSRHPAEAGYARGVPMGGDLRPAPADATAPTFLVGALKDSIGANLDRIQIVKGWLDETGATHEKVYDVIWAGERVPEANGKLPPVGSTVDLERATFTNAIGAGELITVWTDPEFDPGQAAFYYARVLEIPTPRWTAYDVVRFGVTMPDEVPMITQERAYTSPIWYTPKH